MIRSLVFTCLVNLSPEFCGLGLDESAGVITQAVEAWEQASDQKDLLVFLAQWLKDNPIETGALA